MLGSLPNAFQEFYHYRYVYLKKDFIYLLVDFFDGVLSSFFLRSSVIMAELS